MKFDIFQHDKSSTIECDMRIRMIPMRDGVRLCTKIYLPLGEGKKAVMFSRSPYNDPANFASAPRRIFLDNNVVGIYQDCRGTGSSEGQAQPYGPLEQNDAEDTINWIAEQEWFNGRLGMEGASYGGAAQWLAALKGQSELVAIAPFMSGCNLYESSYIGGALFLQLKVWWALNQHYKRYVKFSPTPDWDELGMTKYRPLKDVDKHADLGEVPYWRHLMEHWVCDESWDYANVLKRPEKIKTPAYIKAGWFDFYNKGSIDSFQALRSQGGTEEARQFTRMVIGPWVHTGNANPDLFDEQGKGEEHYRVGERFLLGLLSEPQKDPVPSEPPVKYFMMVKNEWRDSATWPPANVEGKAFYFHADAPANTSKGAGTLDELKPVKSEEPDHYVYDPENPVLSRGGCFLGPPECGKGSVTQMCIENRNDVLCYTSAPLGDDLEVAGNVNVALWAASSCVDTDFTAKLVDVHPDGTSYNVVEGIQRARFRMGCDKEVFLAPEQPELILIDLWHTAYAFLKGHRLRVHISSSSFPHYDPNMNTGNRLGDDVVGVKAHQTIYHDPERPSHIILPIHG